MWGRYPIPLFASELQGDQGFSFYSDCDPLDFSEGDFIRSAIVELRRSRAFMRGDSLGALDRAAVQQIGCDAGSPEGVAVWRVAEAGVRAAALDHAKSIDAAQAGLAEAAFFRHGAEQRPFGRVAERGQVGVEIFLRLVMDRHGMRFAAFFGQPQPPPFALLGVVLDVHADDGRDAGEAKDHDPDQRAIAQGRRLADNEDEMRRRNGVCTYCGSTGVPLERGHVVPKSLYPDSRKTSRLQLITVPECATCNRGWSDDEAHFRTVLLLAGEPNDSVREIWTTKAAPSFSHADGRRRVLDIWERLVPVEVENMARHMIYPGRDERVIRIIKKIVGGLSHFHGIESRVDPSRIFADVLRYPVPDELWREGTFHERESDIFRYWFRSYEDDREKELSSLWILTFFDQRTFIAVVDQVNRPTTRTVSGVGGLG
jgi:hypothetical protein